MPSAPRHEARAAHRTSRTRRSAGWASDAAKIGSDARQVLQIGRLAVAPVEPNEDAEDLRVPLRRHDRIGLARKRSRRNRPLRAAPRHRRRRPCVSIAGGDGDAGIHGQRSDVIGRRPDQRILEIDEAEPVVAASSARQMMLGEWIVAQHQALFRRRRAGRGRRSRPRRKPGAAPTRSAAADIGRQIPVEQQLGLDQHRVAVEGRNVVEHAGRRFQPTRAMIGACMSASSSAAAA